MLRRRALVSLAVATAIAPLTASARQGRATDGPLLVGVESTLVRCGLADAWRRAFAASTGLAFTVLDGPGKALLHTLETGELDAAITGAPELEAELENAGLSHDRRPVARSHRLLVGPAASRAVQAADAVETLRGIARAGLPFLSRADGSGAHLAEQRLWFEAGISPAPPWYRIVGADGAALLRQAADQGAHALVDLPVWLAGPTRGLRIVVERDPRLASPYHVQRPFRARHNAAKLFVAWLAGPGGIGVVSRHGKGLSRP